MQVTRLEVSGFKSFADPIVMDFPQRLCAIVGPNGCGKSNVVDAVRWVLGEQSAKQLRGSAMEDVLFNGAEGRPATSLAEVSLVFENQGTITHPQFADLAEIMVTRRLYRSGESEYLINRVPCRLKDISQLLMGTGLGNRAYAIIEQGRVAAFIEAKPEERRLWLEEAAGITRYKNQKKVSLRKMQAAQENLSRVSDILLEVERQMKRLDRQAKKAERHRKLRNQIRELDLTVSSFEYNHLLDQDSEAEAEAEAVGAQLLLANQRVTGLETDQETLKVRLVAAEQEISQAASRKLEAQGAIQKTENELTLLGREASNQRRLAERFSAEREELWGRLAQLEKEISHAKGLCTGCANRLEQGKSQVAQAAQEVAASRQKVAEREEALDRAKEALVDLLSSLNRAQGRLGDLEQAFVDLARRQEQAEGRRQALEQELAAGREACAKAAEQASALGAKLEQLEQEARRLATLKQGVQAELSRLARQSQEARARRAELAASVEALSGALASHQWVHSEVRRVLEAAGRRELPVQVRGLVAEHLEVDSGAEALVEAALGSDLQALVVRSAQEALDLAAWVDEQGLGRMRIVALDELAAEDSGAPAGTEPLAGMVKALTGYQPLMALLNGAGAAADFTSGWQAARQMLPGQQVVCAQGQRMHRPGAASVGSGAGESVLSQRRRLKKRRSQLAEADEQNAALDEQTAGSRQELSRLEEKEAKLAQAREQLRSSLARAEQEAARSSQALAIKQHQQEMLEFDQEEIALEQGRVEEERGGLEERLGEMEQEQAEREQELNQAQRQLAQARQDLEQSRQGESQARLAQAALENKQEQAQAELERLQRERQATESRSEDLVAEVAAAERAVAELRENHRRQETSLGELYENLEKMEKAHRSSREGYQRTQVELSDLESALKQARVEQQQVSQESQELQFRRRELHIRKEQLCDQVLERCRVDLTLDHQAHLPSGAFDPEVSRARMQKLRERLRRMGPVNLEALSEHQTLAERYQFLSQQRADLEASLQDLHRAIAKINRTSRGRFTETLEQVNQRLQEVFPVLFGGGQARLELEAGKDPLDAGLHIMVELPGKKLRTLDSLSGGEKALTAAAVLFALFLIRPAPLCILDEVDAPLDESNVNRFHALLKRLAQHSQILLVTHNRRTMEEMEQLYGVTMEEKGVSKLLSVTLNGAKALAA